MSETTHSNRMKNTLASDKLIMWSDVGDAHASCRRTTVIVVSLFMRLPIETLIPTMLASTLGREQCVHGKHLIQLDG